MPYLDDLWYVDGVLVQSQGCACLILGMILECPWTVGVKNVKQCSITTKLGKKKKKNPCWCKLRMMMTFKEVKGQQRSNVVYICGIVCPTFYYIW